MHASLPSPAGRRRGLQRAFTLIELLAVMSIVAVLLTLAVPRYLAQVEASKEAVLQENLRLTREVIGHFYGDQGRYPDSLAELVERNYLRALPLDPLTESTDTWQFEPVPDGAPGQIYNLRSGAPGRGRNGIPYSQW